MGRTTDSFHMGAHVQSLRDAVPACLSILPWHSSIPNGREEAHKQMRRHSPTRGFIRSAFRIVCFLDFRCCV